MRYCSMYDQTLIGRITLRQYFLIMRAVQLKHVDDQRNLHIQAWLNNQVKATKQKGKKTVAYFKSFDEFFINPEMKKIKKVSDDIRYNSLKELMFKTNVSK